VTGRREIGDAALVVIAREAGQTADLTERSRVEQAVDPLAAGQLRACALADDPRVAGIGIEAGVGDRLQRPYVGQHRGPTVLAIDTWGGVGMLLRRRDGRDDLPGRDLVADGELLNLGDRSVAGRGHRCLHLHGADHQEHVTRLHHGADLHRHLEDGARHRALDPFVAVRDLQRGRRRLDQRGSACATRQRRGLLVQQDQRTRGRRSRFAHLSEIGVIGEEGRACVTRSQFIARQDRAQLTKVGRQAADVELVERP